MNRLYPPFWSTGFRAWPVHLGMHHAGLRVLQLTLQMQMGAAGFSLLLPGVFLSGLIFDRGSGIFAVHRRRRRARATDHSIAQLLNTVAPIRNVALPSASSALHSLFEAGGKLGERHVDHRKPDCAKERLLEQLGSDLRPNQREEI